MNAVFLDTVGLISTWDEADQWHTAAEAAFAQITSERRPFVTTTFILLECGNYAARRPYRKEVSVLRQQLELRNELIVPTEQDWQPPRRHTNDARQDRPGLSTTSRST